jgi:hypothetical protein
MKKKLLISLTLIGSISGFRPAFSMEEPSNVTAKIEDVLVIMDMQPGFEAANNIDLQRNILEEVSSAKKNGNIIISIAFKITEFELTEWVKPLGETLPFILSACEGYPKFYKITKGGDSGFSAIKNWLTAHEIMNIGTMRFCGVNTEACVYRTIMDVSHTQFNKRCFNKEQEALDYAALYKLPTSFNSFEVEYFNRFARIEKIIVVARCCNSNLLSFHDGHLKSMERVFGVFVERG